MDRNEWFKSRKWGIFVHYLHRIQNGLYINTHGENFTDWNTCVNEFDVELFAKQMNELRCGYVVFTVGQGMKYWCAPNEIYNRITGYKTGEACSSRDLIADLIAALKVYDIPLFLYFTGDGPYQDAQAGDRMGLRRASITEQVDEKFVRHWGMVLKEYSLRYGTDIKGWWIDGCYNYLGYTDPLLEHLKECASAGNPDALITFNNGVEWKDYDNPKFAQFYNPSDCPIRKMEKIEDAMLTGLYDDTGYMEIDIEKQMHIADDYPAGEKNDFTMLPSGKPLPFVWHTLSFLGITTDKNPPKPPYQSNGSGWGAFGSRYSAQYMYDYVSKVNERGGVVSIDVALFRDGSLDAGQVETLRLLKDIL